MPRQTSEQYVPSESPASTTSTGTANVQTIQPTSRRAVGVWITVETTAARVTFDGSSPGNGTGPGLVIASGAPPQFFPFPFNTAASGAAGAIKFASAAAGNSIVSVVFAQ